MGFTALPLTRTSQWQWGPVLLPVLPSLAICSPCATFCPTFTSKELLWAYKVESPLPWSMVTQ